MPAAKQRLYKWAGKELTIKDLVNLSGITESTLRYRLDVNNHEVTAAILCKQRIKIAPHISKGWQGKDGEVYTVFGEELSATNIETRYDRHHTEFKSGIKAGLNVYQSIFGVFGNIANGLSMLDGWKVAMNALPANKMGCNCKLM
jgi:hypothetical protein